MEATEITLIQCTDSKHDTAMEARNIYTPSAYFRAMRRWAQARGGPWFILSAKHGVLYPKAEIKPYDARGLDENQARAVAQTIAKWDVATVHITAGRDYTAALIPELERRGIDVVNHFTGCQIGERRAKLEAAARTLENRTIADFGLGDNAE